MVAHASGCDCPPQELGQRVRAMLPDDLRNGYHRLLTGPLSRSNEHEAVAAARWLTTHGDALGLRIPNTSERGRALGLLPYLRTMGLTDAQLYNAQGNSFDRCIVGLRLGPIIARWLAGGDTPVLAILPLKRSWTHIGESAMTDRQQAGGHPWRIPPLLRLG